MQWSRVPQPRWLHRVGVRSPIGSIDDAPRPRKSHETMATVAVFVPTSPGHLNPMGSLARELVHRGHRVVFLSVVESADTIRKMGVEVVTVGARDFPVGKIQEFHDALGHLKGLKALRYTLHYLSDYTKMLMRDAPAALTEMGAELVLVDQATPAGGAVADHLQLPFVTVSNALLFNLDMRVPAPITAISSVKSPISWLRSFAAYLLMNKVTKPIRKVVNDQRVIWGLPTNALPDNAYSKLAQISQQPREFEFAPRVLPPHFHFAGPFQDPQVRAPVAFPFAKLDGRPLIYASLGTLQNRMLWIFRAIAEACAGLDVQLVISLGGSAEPESLGPLAGNPIVVKSAPQLELLDRARLTITHAGLNTALESLARGVPMVAIPITNDQPGVAGRIAWTGTGVVIPPARLTVTRLKAAVQRVLSEPSFAENAARLREAIARTQGVVRAADIIEKVLETRQPVLAEFSHPTALPSQTQ